MRQPRCDMESLVLAQRDGRLDQAETASVERHLRSCSTCKRAVDEIEALARLARAGQPPPLGKMAQRRRRVALLRDAAAPPKAADRPPGPARVRARRGAPLFMMATALAVACVLGGMARSNEPLELARSWTGGRLLGELALEAAPIRATVTAAPRARFTQKTLREAPITQERVRLIDGRIDIHVERLGATQRFVVSTEDAEVEVRGTRFIVVAASRRLEAVEVWEGRVEVRRGDETIVLDAGQSWRKAEPVAATEHAEVPAQSVRAPTAIRPPAATSDSALPDGEPLSAPIAQPPLAHPRSDASRVFSGALAQLEHGDYDAASASFRRFVQDNPDDARAEDADYLNIVALQRAGRHATAALAAKRYLARYPNGARRAWATEITGNQQSSRDSP